MNQKELTKTFKMILKKSSVSMFYTKVFQRSKGGKLITTNSGCYTFDHQAI